MDFKMWLNIIGIIIIQGLLYLLAGGGADGYFRGP